MPSYNTKWKKNHEIKQTILTWFAGRPRFSNSILFSITVIWSVYLKKNAVSSLGRQFTNCRLFLMFGYFDGRNYLVCTRVDLIRKWTKWRGKIKHTTTESVYALCVQRIPDKFGRCALVIDYRSTTKKKTASDLKLSGFKIELEVFRLFGTAWDERCKKKKRHK